MLDQIEQSLQSRPKSEWLVEHRLELFVSQYPVGYADHFHTLFVVQAVPIYFINPQKRNISIQSCSGNKRHRVKQATMAAGTLYLLVVLQNSTRSSSRHVYMYCFLFMGSDSTSLRSSRKTKLLAEPVSILILGRESVVIVFCALFRGNATVPSCMTRA